MWMHPGRTSRRASAVDNALEDIGIDTADPEAFQYVPGIGECSRDAAQRFLDTSMLT